MRRDPLASLLPRASSPGGSFSNLGRPTGAPERRGCIPEGPLVQHNVYCAAPGGTSSSIAASRRQSPNGFVEAAARGGHASAGWHVRRAGTGRAPHGLGPGLRGSRRPHRCTALPYKGGRGRSVRGQTTGAVESSGRTVG
eukprot:scaffold926_cov408-Prasinococcus_capsulatus_cf.AAC.48